VAQPTDRRQRTLEAAADESGAFRIANAPFGMYEIAVAGQYAPAAAGGWPNVEVESPTAVHVDLIAKPYRWSTIRGRVTYSDHAPAPYAHVNAWSSETITDLSGGFALYDVPPGRHEIRVTAIDGAVWNGEAAAGDEHFVVVLERAGGIAGTVGGAGPLWYIATKYKTDVGRWTAEVRDGRFSIEGIPSGSYVLQLFPPQAGGPLMDRLATPEAEATVAVLPGQTSMIHVVAENDRNGSGTVAGRALLYPSEQPAADISCVAAGTSTTVQADGNFEISGVTAGTVAVQCYSPMSMTGPMTLGETLATVSDGAVVNVTVWTVRAELDNVGDFGAKLVPAQGVLPKAMMFHAVEPNGPAHVAGLEDGDVLVAVGGTRADGHFAQIATYYAQTRPPGTQVVLRVRRVGVDADLEFELKVRR
jgi:hypothetical protein